jgi:hypothetical protein
MYDPRDGLRHLVHDSDGGSGMRHHDGPRQVGAELDDRGRRYRVVRVEPALSPTGFGHVRAELDEN